LPLTMFVVREDFRNPIDGDTGSLLDGERMIGWLQFDVRPYPVVAKMNAGLQILGAGVKRQFGGQPAEERPDLRTLRCLETGHKLIEVGLAERNPHTPGEWLGCAVNGNFETPQNKEKFTVDNAGVATQRAAIIAIRCRNSLVVKRRSRADGRHPLMPFIAALAFEPKHRSSPGSRSTPQFIAATSLSHLTASAPGKQLWPKKTPPSPRGKRRFA